MCLLLTLGAACGESEDERRVTPADGGAQDAVYSRRPDARKGAAKDAALVASAPDVAAPSSASADAAATSPAADAAPAPAADPAPWTLKDLGVTGAPAGSVTPTPTAFILRGVGKGVGGPADSCTFVGQRVTGDFELVAKLRSIQMGQPTAQAGFMVRASDAPGAANLFVVSFADTGMGGNVLVREATGGMAKAVLPMNDINLKPGTFIRVVREGKRLSVYRTGNRATWTRVAVVDVDLSAEAHVGFASASVADTPLLSEVDFLKVSNLDVNLTTRGIQIEDLGTLGGTALFDGRVLSLGGYGQAISVTQEFGMYALRQASGAQRLTVRVDSLDGPDAQSRVGIMVRDGQPLTMSRSAKHALLAVTKEGGVEFQSRAAQGGNTAAGMKKAGFKLPLWLRLEKVDDATGSAAKLVGSYSSDGARWEMLDAVTLTLPEPFLLGLLVNAGAGNGLARANLFMGEPGAAPGPGPALAPDAGPAPRDARTGN
jgi:hypothetical protein